MAMEGEPRQPGRNQARGDGKSAGAQGTKEAEPGASARELGEKAESTVRQAAREARAGIEQGKAAAADQAEAVAGAARHAAQSLEDQIPSLAEYVQRLSSGAAQLAERLRTQSVDQLVGEAQSVARRNPAIVLLGSIIAGVAISRFLKASADRERNDESWMDEQRSTSERTSERMEDRSWH